MVAAQQNEPQNALSQFKASLVEGDAIAALRAGIVGEGTMVDGPFGPKPLVYADYVASGRAVMQVERFVLEQVLPYYANSHTEASYCGATMTNMRRQARQIIANACNAGPEYATIFAGSGATAGLNRLVTLLGLSSAETNGKRFRVIIGPYEHHSNILPWRESSADVIEIGEDGNGGPDMAALEDVLADSTGFDRVICAFSAASNVTGIKTDIAEITRRAKAAGALMVWDFAGGAPYLPVSVQPAPGVMIDAIALSPHKFIGGPGASGVLIVRREAVLTTTPTWTGGGTVRFVSARGHDYADALETREEAGTPNVVGDIRAALTFIIKQAIGDDFMRARNTALVARAFAAWSGVDQIELLGPANVERLPIFSFRIRNGAGGFVHQQLITRLLSDRYGIQARGGCACAGPYVHRLLGIDTAQSEAMRKAILAGNEIEKPGFTRLNFSVLMSDEKVDYILKSVAELASEAPRFVPEYGFDADNAIFYPL